METTLTQQQKIQILSEDFLDRDQGTLVKSRKDGRLNWESTIKDGGAYSEFVLHPKSDEDLITNACSIATDMLRVMDAPQKISVRITPERSCTDSSTVWVATKVFDDADMDAGRKLDTFIGLAVHEGCHLLYTDFDRLKSCENDTVMALQNIIEDERIERRCGDSRPGLSNFLAASKYYYFDKYRLELQKQGRLESLDAPKRLMNAILAYIRYPKALELSDVKEFCDTLLAVRSILSTYPSTTQESLEAARKIFEAMKEHFRNEARQQSGQSENQESGQDAEHRDGESPDTPDSRPSSGPSESSDPSEMERSISEMKDAMNQLSKPSYPEEMKDEDVSDTVKKEDGRVGHICDGSIERGTQPNTYVRKAADEKDVYEESRNRIKRYIPVVSKSIRCLSSEYKLNLRGMRSGVLDTGKLAEAIQGVPTVYLREGQVKADRIAVCILIDESGSMWGAGEDAARDAAVLLNEALGTIHNVDLYIYGHTASKNTTDLYVYRERSFRSKYALGATGSRAGNHDSFAILEAAARVRKHTSERCLFFVISDGAPNEPTSMVRRAVQLVEKAGFSLLAISIDPYYDPATMYDNNITFSDMQSLAVEVGKMVKKSVLGKVTKRLV